jgi:hypothetical protein
MIVEEQIDSHNYKLIHYTDSKECYETVKDACEKYWESAPKLSSKENYDFSSTAKPWSLGPMLENNLFEGGYTVLSVDDKPWSFGGIRKYNDEIALVLARHFSLFTIKPITHGLLLPFHLKVAKSLGYKKAWITINDYNLHWYNIWHLTEFNNEKRKGRRNNVLYTNSDECVQSCTNLGKMVINNVEQTVLEWVV